MIIFIWSTYQTWDDMNGMRNQLIHEYFGVDLRVIWRTYKEDLPELKEQLKKII